MWKNFEKYKTVFDDVSFTKLVVETDTAGFDIVYSKDMSKVEIYFDALEKGIKVGDKIISVDGKNTETKGTYMVYQALYSPFTVFLRPINMALSEVNHDKYPDIKQKFRLEEITHEEFNEINTSILPDKLFRDIMGSMQTP